MRSALPLFLAALVAAPRLADSQEAREESRVTPPDSATIARLKDELDWRKKIRVQLLSGGRLELRMPSVNADGIDFAEARWLDGPLDSVPSILRPVPFPVVYDIRVRQGHRGTGIAIGAALGFGLGAWLAVGSLDTGGAIAFGLLTALPGALFGLFLGEALYTWEPVYEAPARAGVDRPGAWP